MREHYENIGRQTGVTPDALADAPTLPEDAAHVWKWFEELRVEFATPGERLHLRDMVEWQEITGQRLEQWEIRAIRAVDRELLSGRRDSCTSG